MVLIHLMRARLHVKTIQVVEVLTRNDGDPELDFFFSESILCIKLSTLNTLDPKVSYVETCLENVFLPQPTTIGTKH